MRLLLASAPHADTFGYAMPPPGLLRLGGWLRRAGVEVALEDLAHRLSAGELPGDDDLGAAAARLLATRLAEADAAASDDPWVLGLSTMGATLPIALVIARELRAVRPDLPVLIGGPGVSGVEEVLLARFEQVDGVLTGEGEEPLTALLTRPAVDGRPDFAGLPGWTWRAPDGAVVREPAAAPLADLDAVAPPAWDLLPPLPAYKALTGTADGLVPVDSGRGCAFTCSFCSIPRFWDRRSRALSPARLADELEALRDLPGAGQAYLCHDIFGADRRHAVAFCEELLARAARDGRPPVPWEVRARLDHLDPELAALMGRAGCYRVLVGVESGAPSVRAAADKDLVGLEDRGAVLDRLAALGDAGVTPILSLVLGLPGEGDAELAATLDLARDAALVAATQVSLHLPNPQPGCTLGDQRAASSRPIEGIPPDMALGAGRTGPERALIDADPVTFSSWSLLVDPDDVAVSEARLRELHGFSAHLPELLMRLPRTVALWCRHSGDDVLALARRLEDRGISFEGLARAARNAALDDALAWEQARLRCVARGPGAAVTRGADVELLVELVASDHDLAELAAALDPRRPAAAARAAALPAPRPGTFAVGRAAADPARPDDEAAAIATRRLSPDLARLLLALRAEALGDPTPLAALDPDLVVGGPARDALLDHLTGLDGGTLLRRRAAAPALP